MITVIDFGMGNVGSVVNMLKRVGVESRLSCAETDILSANQLILPGVGAFGKGMENLRRKGLIEVLEEAVFNRGKPILGICLGMQLLLKSSSEAPGPGLGWIDGEVVRFSPDESEKLRVPHMGWSTIRTQPGSTLFAGLAAESRFYFVHSYHAVCRCAGDVAAYASYGIDFVAAIERRNIFGVQFHPEKSHRFGADLLRRFAEQTMP